MKVLWSVLRLLICEAKAQLQLLRGIIKLRSAPKTLLLMFAFECLAGLSGQICHDFDAKAERLRENTHYKTSIQNVCPRCAWTAAQAAR